VAKWMSLRVFVKVDDRKKIPAMVVLVSLLLYTPQQQQQQALFPSHGRNVAGDEFYQ
jgi:hypothetical protein